MLQNLNTKWCLVLRYILVIINWDINFLEAEHISYLIIDWICGAIGYILNENITQ